MTIKTQGGKVITKDGKVSCECCEGPEPGCCMYSAQALADGLYTENDLPDAIVITYSSSLQTFGPYTLTRSGSVFSGGPSNEVLVEFAGDLWAVGDGSGGIGSFPCLINDEAAGSGFTVTTEDQFADTYTVSGNPDFNQTVARTSLGFWIGEGTGVQESNATVFYMRCSDLRIGYSESDWDAWWMTLGASDTIAKKTGDQNTPEGSYPFGDIIGTMTVS